MSEMTMNAMQDEVVRPVGVVRVISPMQQMYWSVRREIWEHKSIWIMPVVGAVLFLFSMFVTLFVVAKNSPDFTNGRSAASASPILQGMISISAAPVELFALFGAIVFTLDALYGERRDRSILFWKSLPVSDGLSVLAKMSVPMMVIPAVTFVTAVVTELILLAMFGALLVANHVSVNAVITHLPLMRDILQLVYGLFVISLWYAPIYAWLLLCSSWAPRAPASWAFVPPLAIVLVEFLGWHTWNVWGFLKYRFTGVFHEAFGAQSGDVLRPMTPGTYFASPWLWVGLIAAAMMLIGAVQLRRYRRPI